MASKPQEGGSQNLYTHVQYIINSIMAIPAMYGYAVILFSPDSMPALSKLVIYSSTCIKLRSHSMSSLSFAIGQVRDAGLLFLTAMTPSICEYRSRFFSAATLIFVAIGLMIEWFVLTCTKMSLREHAVLWMAVIAVNLVALDKGMLIGVGIAIVSFLLDYIRLPVAMRKPRSSGTARTLVLQSVRADLDRVQKAVYVARNFRGYKIFCLALCLDTFSRSGER